MEGGLSIDGQTQSFKKKEKIRDSSDFITNCTML